MWGTCIHTVWSSKVLSTTQPSNYQWNWVPANKTGLGKMSMSMERVYIINTMFLQLCPDPTIATVTITGITCKQRNTFNISHSTAYVHCLKSVVVIKAITLSKSLIAGNRIIFPTKYYKNSHHTLMMLLCEMCHSLVSALSKILNFRSYQTWHCFNSLIFWTRY